MIAFLVKTYPKLSETFIAGEIAGLLRAGTALRVFALEVPTDTDVALATPAPAQYCPRRGVRAWIVIAWAHARLALRRPSGYCAALGFALAAHRREWPRVVARAGWLAWRMQRAGIRHVHVHFASDPADVAELACRFAPLTYSISAHAKDIYRSAPVALERKLASAVFTVTCTEHNRRFLSALDAPNAPIYRMYHGVERARFATLRVSATAPVPMILSVGRLREKKGFPILIDACARLAAEGRVFRCEIVGYGPDAARLQARIEGAGLTHHVRLAGKLAHDDVISRYRAASIFVLPCQIAADGDRDGIPNVLLEAMAAGLPVVTTDVSGIPEAVANERNGLLVPTGDPRALAAALARLLDDAPLRARLGAAGARTVASRFDNARNLECVRALLREVDTPSGRVRTLASPRLVDSTDPSAHSATRVATRDAHG